VYLGSMSGPLVASSTPSPAAASTLASWVVDTSTTGVKTYVAVATDAAGRQTQATWTLTVKEGYRLSGFFSPVNMYVLDPSGQPTSQRVANLVNGGRTIPLKFEVFNSSTGVEITDPSIVFYTNVNGVTSPLWTQSTGGANNLGVCNGMAQIPLNSPSGLKPEKKFDGSQFSWNQATSKVRANECWVAKVIARDGSFLDAYFILTP
jgi:hypothetical protein